MPWFGIRNKNVWHLATQSFGEFWFGILSDQQGQRIDSMDMKREPVIKKAM